jgi:hypothetical protein
LTFRDAHGKAFISLSFASDASTEVHVFQLILIRTLENISCLTVQPTEIFVKTCAKKFMLLNISVYERKIVFKGKS